MATPTFWVETAERVRLALRRYRPAGGPVWACTAGWHEAVVWTDLEVPAMRGPDGYLRQDDPGPVPQDDPGWPVRCDHCDYQFTDRDTRQAWQALLYRRTDTGQLRVLHPSMTPPGIPTVEAGGSWNAFWMPEAETGPDGISLTVRCPHPSDPARSSGDWHVDGPASDGARWFRTGDPRACTVTVSPSIIAGDPGSPDHYHGWLRNGVLSDHIG